MMSFAERVRAAAERNGSLLCVGLDPNLERFPPALRARYRDDPGGAIVAFNRAIVEATADLVCAYKPNLGFYLAYGLAGLAALAATRALVPRHIPMILDAKVNDLGHTAEAYATGYFDHFDFDAVTANPYLGTDSLRPLFARRDRGVLILCHTSNPSAGELQELPVAGEADGADAPPLYQVVARRIAHWSAREAAPGACGAVIGATFPRELATVRGLLPDVPLLILGIGEQGAALEETVRAGVDASGFGAIISVSRAVTYASSSDDFAEAARRVAAGLREAIERERAAGLAGWRV